MTPQSIAELETEIAHLVRTHMESHHRAVMAAVTRALSAGALASSPKKARAPRGPRRSPKARRSAEELRALEEQLMGLIEAEPGEVMAVLAPRMGQTPRSMEVPVRHLKRAGRVRSVGNRPHTRYFPMAVARPEAAE